MDDKSLDALFTGLTEIAAPPPENQKQDAKQPKQDRKGRKPKATATEETVRRRQKMEERGDERFCTIVKSDLLNSMRIIANREGLQIREVVEAAFTKAIHAYERKHGKLEYGPRKNLNELF